MRLYTKKGDKGYTGILGREKLQKDDIRIEAYGTIDELNSILGLLYHSVDENLYEDLRTIQSVLFEIGSELASVDKRDKLVQADITHLERLIDQASEQTEELKSFILPGGAPGASWLHVARTTTRRAERRIVSLASTTEINDLIIPYINRLSDLFFAWARLDNHLNNVPDVKWEARK